MEYITAFVVLGILVSAYLVVKTDRLLMVAVWLAANSALVASLLYILGAYEIAVIELSVGAGLVTVLFVFAFSIVGETDAASPTIIPKPLVWGLALLSAGLLSWLTYPITSMPGAGAERPFTEVLWQERSLDVLAQIVIIFSGVLGVLGLLAEVKATASEPSIQRERQDIAALDRPEARQQSLTESPELPEVHA